MKIITIVRHILFLSVLAAPSLQAVVCPICMDERADNEMIETRQAFHSRLAGSTIQVGHREERINNCSCKQDIRICRICLHAHVQQQFDSSTTDLHINPPQMTHIKCPLCNGRGIAEELARRYNIPGNFSQQEAQRRRERAIEDHAQEAIRIATEEHAQGVERIHATSEQRRNQIIQEYTQEATHVRAREADLGYQDPANFIDLDGIDIEEQRALLAAYSNATRPTGRNQPTNPPTLRNNPRASSRPPQPPTQQVEPYSNTVTAIILLGGISYLTWEFSKDKVKAWWRTQNPAVKRRYKRLAAIGGLGATTGIGYVIAKKMMLRP